MHFYYAKRMIVCSGDGERWKILSSSLSPAYGISRIVNATILPAMLEILFFIRVTILFDREFSHEFPFSFFSFRIPEILSSVCVKISFHRTMSYSLVARLFLLIVLIFISLSFREKYPR